MAETHAEQLIEEVLGQALSLRKLTLAVAESCTGGLICSRLTNVPGSSAYFLGGMVVYSYEAKERLLGVRHATLYDHGAVSEPTAREMAQGVRETVAADLGLAVTGIAGPGGGMPGKPVGLTWIALSSRDKSVARQFIWQGDSLANKSSSAEAALRLVKDYLDGAV